MRFLEIAGNFKRNSEWDVIRDMRVRGGIVHNMTNLPIPGIGDSTYDGVYSEHFIEHLTKDQGIEFLKEMRRVMKDGAVIRTIWPSMDFVDQLRTDASTETHPFVVMYNQYIIDRENPFNNSYYKTIPNIAEMSKREKAALRLLHQEGEHKHLWYKQELIDVLTELGFKDAREHQYRQSRLDKFNEIDNKDPMRTLHSTVIEATK